MNSQSNLCDADKVTLELYKLSSKKHVDFPPYMDKECHAINGKMGVGSSW